MILVFTSRAGTAFTHHLQMSLHGGTGPQFVESRVRVYPRLDFGIGEQT